MRGEAVGQVERSSGHLPRRQAHGLPGRVVSSLGPPRQLRLQRQAAGPGRTYRRPARGETLGGAGGQPQGLGRLPQHQVHATQQVLGLGLLQDVPLAAERPGRASQVLDGLVEQPGREQHLGPVHHALGRQDR